MEGDPDLWPDAATLAAGDEGKERDTGWRDTWASRLEAAQRRPFQEDGALVMISQPPEA